MSNNEISEEDKKLKEDYIRYMTRGKYFRS